VSSVALTENFVASASSDKVVGIWSVPGGEKVRELRFKDFVFSVDFCGSQLACGSRDGSVTVWGLPEGKRLLGFRHSLPESTRPGHESDPYPIHAVAMKGDILACAPADLSAVLWRMPSSLTDAEGTADEGAS